MTLLPILLLWLALLAPCPAETSTRPFVRIDVVDGVLEYVFGAPACPDDSPPPPGPVRAWLPLVGGR